MSAPGSTAGAEAAALAALDLEVLRDDLVTCVQIASPVGRERALLTWLADRAAGLGLRTDLHQHDLAALRAHPDQPGEEVAREELWGLAATLPAADPGAPRLALCGHVDVVGPGTVPWRLGSERSGAIEDGRLHGRGSVDMKAGVIAALHAIAAVREGLGAAPACEAVLLAVSAAEDGGLGAFAELERDAGYAGCVLTEPTGWDVVCVHAGALTFTGTVHGTSAHAAHRLEGTSAIDRYLPVHAALADLELALNDDVEDGLMAKLALPYPLVVGEVAAGTWPGQVPDRLTFRGRAPVRIGEDPAAVRAAVRTAIEDATTQGDPPVDLVWTGGQVASGATDPGDPLVRLVSRAVQAERARPTHVTGVPWGADMRLFCARGIPTTMLGTPGAERAYAVDEHVALDDVATLTRALVRLLCRYGA